MEQTHFFSYAAHTDIGRKRKENQDNFQVFFPKSEEEQKFRGFLFVVADGMGGHLGGKTASQLAVNTICEKFKKSSERFPQKALKQSLKDANTAIFNSGASHADLRGMGSTCTALVLKPEIAYVAQVGDSRAYKITPNGIRQLTHDHSIASEMERKGMLSAEEAARHPDRNILTRALGVSSKVRVDIFPVEFQTGEILLLCSDGLYNEVEPEEIWQTVRDFDAETACQKLIAQATANGGRDNITAIIIHPKPATVKSSIANSDRAMTPEDNTEINTPQALTVEIDTKTAMADTIKSGKQWLEKLNKIPAVFIVAILAIILLIYLIRLPFQHQSQANQSQLISALQKSHYSLDEKLAFIQHHIDTGHLVEVTEALDFFESLNLDTSQLFQKELADMYLRLGHAERDENHLRLAERAYLKALECEPQQDEAQQCLDILRTSVHRSFSEL